MKMGKDWALHNMLIFQTYVDIMWNFGNVNVTAIVFSVVTISTLVIFNEVVKVCTKDGVEF